MVGDLNDDSGLERILAKGGGRIYMGETVLTPASDGTTTATDLTILKSLATNTNPKNNAFFYINENGTNAFSYNMKFTNFTFEGWGIFMDLPNSTPVERVVISDCHFETGSVVNQGIEFDTGLRYSSIINNLFEGGDNGIYGESHWIDLRIANNEFRNGHEGMHLVESDSDAYTSTLLLVEQNRFFNLARMAVEIQGGGRYTIVQDNHYRYDGEQGYTGDTQAYSIPHAEGINPTIRRNYAMMELSSEASNGIGVVIAFELGGNKRPDQPDDPGVQMYDNYSEGGNNVILGSGVGAKGTAHSNRILRFREDAHNADYSSNDPDIIFTNNGPGYTVPAVAGTYYEDGPDVQLTWDYMYRPMGGPHRRIYGLSLNNGLLTLHGTPFKDSVAVAIEGSNLVLTLNGERFEYLASEIDAVQFVDGKHLSSLTIGNGATVVVAEQATPNDPDGVFIVDSLSIAPGGVLDLNNNSMIIDYTGTSPLSTVFGLIRSGANGLAWNGDGITSSLADNTTYGLGFGEESLLDKDIFAGHAVDSTSILIKYTYLGDLNLDGQVTIQDLVLFAPNWQTTGYWTAGDFDYTEFIDADDLGFISRNWQAGVGDPLRGGGSEPTYEDILVEMGLSSEEIEELLETWGSNAHEEVL